MGCVAAVSLPWAICADLSPRRKPPNNSSRNASWRCGLVASMEALPCLDSNSSQGKLDGRVRQRNSPW